MPVAIDHPMITVINRTGYPRGMQEQNCGSDALGNEILIGDELLVLDDEKFVKEELSEDAIEILQLFGAETEIAK